LDVFIAIEDVCWNSRGTYLSAVILTNEPIERGDLLLHGEDEAVYGVHGPSDARRVVGSSVRPQNASIFRHILGNRYV
jgi:hypothetical protein